MPISVERCPYCGQEAEFFITEDLGTTTHIFCKNKRCHFFSNPTIQYVYDLAKEDFLYAQVSRENKRAYARSKA